MRSLFHALLIPIGLIIVAAALKSSGPAIYRKNVDFKSLDEQIRAEIEQSFWKTLSRLSHFEMGLPAKIVVQRMENEEGNTFNDPFLVGNAHEVRAYHYMSEPIDDWCSGVVSRHTQHYFEHKNRRIHVTFDCNRKMALPSLRTTVGWCLVGILVNVVIVIARVLVPTLWLLIRRSRPYFPNKNQRLAVALFLMIKMPVVHANFNDVDVLIDNKPTKTVTVVHSTPTTIAVIILIIVGCSLFLMLMMLVYRRLSSAQYISTPDFPIAPLSHSIPVLKAYFMCLSDYEFLMFSLTNRKSASVISMFRGIRRLLIAEGDETVSLESANGATIVKVEFSLLVFSTHSMQLGGRTVRFECTHDVQNVYPTWTVSIRKAQFLRMIDEHISLVYFRNNFSTDELLPPNVTGPSSNHPLRIGL